MTGDFPAISCDALLAHSWRHLDLFSGIGGFALACRMVGGIETVGFCERELYAQRVLKKHWPDVPICNDIHELKGTDYGPIDLITGGFPCQPYSLAGERRGNEDDRALWPEMLRVIRKARPRWVLGENVPGIITLALDGVLADLEGEGYACETLCIPACGVDAWHRRDRVWIVAHESARPNEGAESLADTAKREDIGREPRDVEEASGCRPCGNASAHAGGKAVSDDDGPRLEGEVPARACAGKSGLPGERCEWLSEPAVGRVAHGIPGRVDRLRGLGNAIVPQVAAEIIAAMKRVDIGANAKGESQP